MSQGFSSDAQRWRRYEFLFDGTADLIFYFSQDGSVDECNKSVYEELGFEPGESLNLQDIFRTCVKLTDMGLIFPDEAITGYYETSIYRKNQTCFPVQIHMALLEPEETGSYAVCRANSVIMEVEAKRKMLSAKEEIEEAHKERNEMVANVTHELRTPVNGVLGLAQNLQETELSKEQQETVDLIIRCCNNMTKIINNILDFSKLQSGKFTIENREFSFHNMMDSVVKMNLPAIEEKGLRLICNVSADIPDKMIGDELRITQVLNNLLSNAMKFTSVGQIVVNVVLSLDFGDEMEIFFVVVDSGIGISEDEKDKLFKSFSQVDASITRKFGGTGLGLSIVKQLVQMMGGDVNVESEKGKGSTFSFSVRTKRVDVPEQTEEEEKPQNLSFHLGAASGEDLGDNEIYRLGTEENLREIGANLERLVLCIEMENWDKANSFAENVKQLVADDPTDLKRKAFRLQMTLRKGDHDTALKEYEILKQAIDEKDFSVINS